MKKLEILVRLKEVLTNHLGQMVDRAWPRLCPAREKNAY